MTSSHSIKTTLSLAAMEIKAQGIETKTAKLEAQLLLQHALNVNRAWLIAHEHENLAPSIEAAYSQVGWVLEPTRLLLFPLSLRVGHK